MTNIRHKINFSKYRNLLYTSAALLMLGLVAVGVNSVKTHNAYAESDTETIGSYDGSPVEASRGFSVYVPEVNALEITLPTTLVAIDVTPSPNTPSFNSTDPLEITVGTTNETGYILTMTPIYNNVVTNELSRTEEINGDTPKIGTLAAKDGGYTLAEFQNSSSTVDAWGYKYSTDRVPETNYLSVEAAAIKLNEYFSPVDSDPTTLTLAAKVSASKPAGEYQTTLKFTATANPVTYAIKFNEGRAADGTIVPDDLTGALNSAATTTVPLNGAEPGSWTGYAFTGWCSVTPTLNGNSDECPAGASSYSSTSEVTMSPDQDIITLYAMWSVRSFGINIKASTGISKVALLKDGTEICSATTTSAVKCGGDAGLPYGTTYDLVATEATGYTFNGWTLDPNDGTLGSTTQKSTTFTVGTQGTLISPSAALNSYTVTVTFAGVGVKSVTFSNATYGSVTATNSNQGGAGTGTVSLKYNVPYTATANFVDNNNEIASWAEGTNTGVSTTGATNPITVTLTGAGNGAMTVTGKSSKTYMQGWTGCSAMAVGTTTTLYDSRDETAYLVGKAKDNNCWMLQNLKLGAKASSYTLTKSNSATSGNFNLTGKLSDGKFTYSTNNGNNYTNDSSQFYCTSDYGCYYNWYTATAGSGTSATGSNVTVNYSICPNGWNLPTGGSSGQFQSLYSQYNSAALMLVDNPTTTKENTAGKIPGFLLGGLYYYNGASNVGSRGFYWSRTAYDGQNGYSLYLGTSSVAPANYNLKYFGYSVRCLAQ